MKRILLKIKETAVQGFYAVLTFVVQHKITSAAILGVIAALVAVSIILTSVLSAPVGADLVSSSSSTVSEIESVPMVSSEPEEAVSSEVPPESTVSSEQAPVASTPVVTQPANTDYKYNSNMSPDNNVFMDALEYTGYNLTAQRNSGLMWASGSNYVLSSRKRGLGWLSNITYDDYGRASGYEVTEQGLPNIAHFEQKGLVCATYAAYVYFNYLPNVAGIDTSSLARPAKSYSANDWYIAGKQWVQAGYSRYIDFTANDGGSIYNDIKFTPAEEIPIGSLIILCDWYNRSDWCSHICIYAGYVNGYHWVTHVGNENGPEFCAIERMNRKPHPQWPIAVITTPSNINFSAQVEITAKDTSGNPISGASFSMKSSSGKEYSLGTTDANGKLTSSGYSYGQYEIIPSIPEGYTCETGNITVSLTTQNNSVNQFAYTYKKVEKAPDKADKNTSNK